MAVAWQPIGVADGFVAVAEAVAGTGNAKMQESNAGLLSEGLSRERLG